MIEMYYFGCSNTMLSGLQATISNRDRYRGTGHPGHVKEQRTYLKKVFNPYLN